MNEEHEEGDNLSLMTVGRGRERGKGAERERERGSLVTPTQTRRAPPILP